MNNFKKIRGVVLTILLLMPMRAVSCANIPNISKKDNLDIFVVKTDGTNTYQQLTYHPANDCCPVWSEDGKYIYFISSRATAKDEFNI